VKFSFVAAYGIGPALLGGLVISLLGLSVGSLVSQIVPPAVPASLPSAKSGLDYFRQLLAASPEERQKLLAGRSAEHRKVLTNGLSRYDALTPAERDYRLRSMELRFHLATLMHLAPSNRAARLQQVPLSERALVEERLRIWDQLSSEDRKDLLEKELLARVVGILVPSPPSNPAVPGNPASNDLHQMELSLGRFNSLSGAKRARIQANFERLFQLPDPVMATEELKSLDLPLAELDLMKKTLEKFRSLPKPQRDACIENFKKLSQLPPEEMRQFLRNAEVWQKMSPEDREQWRRLVNKLIPLPPLPPGLTFPPSPRQGSPPRPALLSTN
jgi:hypothetical protein